MKKSVLVYLLIFLVKNLAFSQYIHENKYLLLAQNKLQNGNYNDCIELCERIIFFDTLNIYYTETNILMADAYSRKGDYRNAALSYNQAYVGVENQEAKNDIIFKCALNYYLSGDTVFAYSEMYVIDEKTLNAKQSDKYHLIMAVLDYKTYRYNSSLQHFLKISDLSNKQIRFLHEKYKKTKKINRRYNPTKVEWLSVIPGLGQLWCGYYSESLNAFLLTGACYALFFNVSIKYDLLDAVLVVYPWFNRYYKGSIIKSYHLAEKKREIERNKILNSILKVLPELEI